MTTMKLLKDRDGLILAEVEQNDDGKIVSVKTWDDDLTETEWMPNPVTKREKAHISKSGKRVDEEIYNGWKNYSTWNVSLWIANDYQSYVAACAFMSKYRGDDPYREFIVSQGLESSKTPDLIKWFGSKLDYKALNEMMWEYSPIGTRA